MKSARGIRTVSAVSHDENMDCALAPLHQEAAPAFNLESPDQFEPGAAVGGYDAVRLVGQEAREDDEGIRREMRGELRRQPPQRVGEDIGQHQPKRPSGLELRR